MNKKGLEDSLFTWIVGFLLIVFFMIVYIALTFAIFSGKGLGGEDEVEIRESNLDYILNARFLSFLNSRILLEEGDVRVIDAIRRSIDPYFEIENNDGENLIEKFGIGVLSESDEEINNRLVLNARNGFDEEDYLAYIDQKRKEEDSEFVRGIIGELNKLCDLDRDDQYYLEIPQGIIRRDGLKSKEVLSPTIFDEPELHTETIYFNLNYRGESFEFRFRTRRECQ